MSQHRYNSASVFSPCRKSTPRRSRSSTASHRTFPRTLSQDTSCSTSPGTEPAATQSPTDCHSTEGEGLTAATGSAQYAHISIQALFPVGGDLHRSAHSDWSRRAQVAWQPPGLRPFKSSEPTLQRAPKQDGRSALWHQPGST